MRCITAQPAATATLHTCGAEAEIKYIGDDGRQYSVSVVATPPAANSPSVSANPTQGQPITFDANRFLPVGATVSGLSYVATSGAGTPVTSSSPPGIYPIKCSGGSAANYTLIYHPGTLTITPASAVTPTSTPTATATSRPTSTPTSTPTDAPTSTPTDAPTATNTPIPTNTPTSTPVATATPRPTSTPTSGPSFPRTSVLNTFNRDNGSVGTGWDGLTGTSFYKIANTKIEHRRYP